MASIMKWLRDNWFILSFVFATGSAFAYQEVQQQSLKQVVIDQAVIVQKQKEYGETIIRLDERLKAQDRVQQSIDKKLDKLIDLQLRSNQ